MDKLPKVIDMVIEAVSAGELDKVLKAALGDGGTANVFKPS